MPPLCCEVIGCQAQARWRCAAPLIVTLEEYLCEQHFQELAHQHPRLSGYFEPLASDATENVEEFLPSELPLIGRWEHPNLPTQAGS